MASEEVIFTVIYVLFCLCVVIPPTEFIAAGFTIQHLFSCVIPKEDTNFVEHHIFRASVTLAVHSLLPLGYFLCHAIFMEYELDDGYEEDITPWQYRPFWQLALAVSLIVPTIVFFLLYRWSAGNWDTHPIVKTLELYATPWESTAARINAEFRQVDKFISGVGSLTRTVVTNSWIIKVTPYSLKLVHQSDAQLTLTGSVEHAVSHISTTGVQFLMIQVGIRRPGIEPFTIQVNSQEFNDLKDKLQVPLENVRNVIIHRNLSDRFVEAFRSHVVLNPKYQAPEDMELEACIGCMQVTANVKLNKLCDEPLQGLCQQCLCRPMWCIDCMGKWFASRQDQSHPENWLNSRCFCPTCRSVFCMVDVCMVEPAA